MELNNQQILNFVEQIKLPREKQADYANQIDTLKKGVVDAISNMENTKVKKVKRAGSWKKGTALRPHGNMDLDVDLVFFVEVAEETEFDSEELRNEIIAVLQEAYPTKSKDDFEKGEKTVGIVFQGSGLKVDIVPFIPDKGNSSYGRQPRKALNEGNFRTSVDKQLDFISNIKGKWNYFAPAVRMAKWWKEQKELEIPSFAVELLFAHLIISDRIESNTTIESALIEFFEFVSADVPIRVEFSGAIGSPLPASSGIPIIADPTNNENNVMEKISQSEWDDVAAKSCDAFEHISYAQKIGEKGGTLAQWRKVFDDFNIQEA